MEITKEFLQQRLEGLNRQLFQLTQQEIMVRGAIQDTQDLLKYMEEVEKEPQDGDSQV